LRITDWDKKGSEAKIRQREAGELSWKKERKDSLIEGK